MKAMLGGVWASDCGQALVEGAIFMPVLLLFLAGVTDLGRLSQFDMQLASSARAGTQYGSQNATNAADLGGMKAAATADAVSSNVTVSATASSYYKCADGTAPSTTGSLTMSGTSSIDCSANHQLLYVIVTTTAKFKPIFLFFLSTGAAHSSTAVMEVGS
jgi:Flp pilus assembly protein TadG